jgi:hypothetical protein
MTTARRAAPRAARPCNPTARPGTHRQSGPGRPPCQPKSAREHRTAPPGRPAGGPRRTPDTPVGGPPMIAETGRRGYGPAASAATVLRPAAFDGTLSSHPMKKPAGESDRRASRVRVRSVRQIGRRSFNPGTEGRTSAMSLSPSAPTVHHGPRLRCAPTPIVLGADEHTIPSFTADVIAFCRARARARVALRRRILEHRRHFHSRFHGGCLR